MIQTSSASELGYLREVVTGQYAIGEFTLIRRVSAEDLGPQVDLYESEEVSVGRSMKDVRHGTRRVEGEVETEISLLELDDLWLAIVGSSGWVPYSGTPVSATMTITGAPSNTIYSATTIFSSLNIGPGTRIRIESAVSANSGYATVLGVSVDGRTLTVDKTLTTTTGTVSIYLYGRRLLPGNTLHTFNLERAFREGSPGLYETMRGVGVSKVTVNVEDEFATAIWEFRGVDGTAPSSTTYNTYNGGANYRRISDESPMDFISGSLSILVNGLPRKIGTVTGIQFDIDNQLEGTATVGSKYTSNMFLGNLRDISGSMSLLFDGPEVQSIFEQELEASVVFSLEDPGDPGAGCLTFAFPCCKFFSADIGDAESYGLPVDFNFRALRPKNGSYAVIINCGVFGSAPATDIPESGLLPAAAPWTYGFTSLDVSRLVVVYNLDISWSYTEALYYCNARGIPTGNLVGVHMGGGGNTWYPASPRATTIGNEFLTPVGNKARSLQAQGVLLGPGIPLLISADDSTRTTSANGPTAGLATMAASWPPVSEYGEVASFSDLYATGGEGNPSTGWAWKTPYTPPVLFTADLDVTAIVNAIRTSGNFSSGGRMNFVIEATSPLMSFALQTTSSTGGSANSKSRLTITQNGGTVYDFQLSATQDDGTELVGNNTYNVTGTMLVNNYGNDSSGHDVGDRLIGISFPSVTADPSQTITQATLTLYSDYGVSPTSGQLTVWGESQVSAAGSRFSGSHLPSAITKVAPSTTYNFAADLSKAGRGGVILPLGYGGFNTRSFLTAANPQGFGVVGYNAPFTPSVNGALETVDNYRSAQLGSVDFYVNQTAYNKSLALPYLPVGRIGFASSEYVSGSLPVFESQEVVRAIVDRATLAMKLHLPNAARLNPLLFHIATFPAGSGVGEYTTWFYNLCRFSWGMTGAKYAYADVLSNSATSEAYAPMAGGAYTNATLPTTPKQDTYFTLGNWLNIANNGPYSPPYSTVWNQMLGSGSATGPSQGWQYSIEALFNGASCVLTDYEHINVYNLITQHGLFWNLLRGMTWLEACYYANIGGQGPVGDPLWAPWGKTTGSSATGDVLTVNASGDHLLATPGARLRVS